MFIIFFFNIINFSFNRKLDSPYIAKFHGACLKPNLTIVQEFAHKGSLFDILSDTREQITWEFVFKISQDILQGLSYLHSNRPTILHRNLKSSNVIVS